MTPQNSWILALSIILLIEFSSSDNDDCEPTLADSCFATGLRSLDQYLFSRRNKGYRNATDIRELCLYLQESFVTCPSDIIDEDCLKQEGYFHSWLKAIENAMSFVCDGDMKNMKAIMDGIHCWNIEKFVNCTETKISIASVKDLFGAKLDENECRMIQDAFMACNQMATESSCREQDDVRVAAQGVIDAFVKGSHCNKYLNNFESDGGSSKFGKISYPIMITNTALFILFLIYM